MSEQKVVIGEATDTGPTFTVTLTRDPADSNTDYTTATAVVLVLPDATTHTVTKTSATAALWVGTIRYAAWFAADGAYDCAAKVTFADTTFFTVPTAISFYVGSRI